MEDMTHDYLIDRAIRWLKKSKNFSLVVADHQLTWTGEIPDVMGWRGSGHAGTQIECKSSRADFLNDKNKYHRRTDTSFGKFRFYLCPAGMIDKDEVPEGWGLLWCYPKQIRTIVKAPPHPGYLNDMARRQERLAFFHIIGKLLNGTRVRGADLPSETDIVERLRKEVRQLTNELRRAYNHFYSR